MNVVDPPPALAVTRSIDALIDPIFISDLHLAPHRPRTMQRFARLMREDVPRYRELVILGDLFEFWIGDDAGADAKPITDALAAAAASGQRVFLMHGNRDPLLGHDFTSAAGATLLADPIIADIAGTTTLLSHGDAWCTRDIAYQQFRAMVRNADFQRDFLGKPIQQRVAIAKSARMQSETEKAVKAMDIMDVTPEAIVAALRDAGVRRIIHGHTHRPAAHVIDLNGVSAERWVLPDWELEGDELRGGYLDFVDGRPRLVFFDD